MTGCSSGFGRHIAEHLLDRGERVVVTARKPEQVDDLAERGEALVLPLDVTDPEQAQGVVSKAEERFGGIDVATMIRAVLPGMRCRRSGTIVNITSVGGLEGYPAVGFYCATKYAVEGLSDVLRKEVAPLGIRVMTVEPGAFRTEWAGSARETKISIADYDATAGEARRAYYASVGQQPGDPAKAAVAITNAVLGASPPMRLLLGADAYEAATAKLGEMLREFTGWEATARSTDFDKPAPGWGREPFRTGEQP